MWTFLQISPLDFMVHNEVHRPRERDKGVSVGKVLGKYKAAPTSRRQHLVPSLPEWRLPKLPLLNFIPLCLIAASENYLQTPLIKLVRGFSVQILFSIIAGKCPILLVLTLRSFIFFKKTPF